jgi:ribosomal protein L13E
LTPKPKSAKKAKPTEPRPRARMPVAAMPHASVESRHLGEMVTRQAKGFSMGEVSQAGVSQVLANRWNLPRDIRRRSVLSPNVEALKGWFSGVKTSAPEAQPKMAEDAKPRAAEREKQKPKPAAPKKEAPPAPKKTKKPAPKKKTKK